MNSINALRVGYAMLRFVYWVLGIFGVMVVVATAAFFVIDWEGSGEELLSAAFGREVQLGSLDINPGWTTTVRVTDMTVTNADWAKADKFLTLDEGEVAVKIWPLITGRTEIPRIMLREPHISLEKNAEGRVNWNLGPGGDVAEEVAEPDERSEFPEIGQFSIEDGRLGYRDEQRRIDLDGRVVTGKADVDGGGSVDLNLNGTLEGRPLELDFTGGSFLVLRNTEMPYPLDLDLRFGNTRVRAKGTMTDLVQLAGINIDLAVVGPTLADVFPIFQIPLPETPPYSLEGALGKDGERWSFENFKGVVGDSDLAGSLSLDYAPKPPFLQADLVSKNLDFEDLAGLVGAEPGYEPKADAGGEAIPDQPIATERLNVMNMDVQFKGEKVMAPNLPVEQLEFRVQLDDRRALVKPLRLRVAGGTVSGEAALNGRQEVPSADADLTFEELDLRPFFEGTQFIKETGGRFSGHAYVLGVGKTVADMLGTARGEAAIAMREGAISGLLVEAAGLDIAEALTLVIGDDARIGILCGRIDLDVEEGKVSVERAIIDTTDSLLIGKGLVDLGQETFDVQIESRAKDFSLIDVAAPVRAYGSFTDPSVAIGGIDPLPFFEMGEQENINCDALISDAFGQQFKKGHTD